MQIKAILCLTQAYMTDRSKYSKTPPLGRSEIPRQKCRFVLLRHAYWPVAQIKDNALTTNNIIVKRCSGISQFNKPLYWEKQEKNSAYHCIIQDCRKYHIYVENYGAYNS
jgi:hypothetical protein